jgi:RNA polymerase sigma-70 factor (ECF subfamily)
VLNDHALVVQLQEGSLDALGELYDRHQTMVFRTALAITGDESAAADLLQDAFLRMHRFASRIDPERPLEPWLYRTTANLSYTWVKRHHRWLRPLEDMAEWLIGDKKESPAQVAESDEESRGVRKAISNLALPQRVVVVLYYVNDLSLQEISEILDLPVGTVKSRLFYGRKALKKQLESDGRGLREVQYEFT